MIVDVKSSQKKNSRPIASPIFRIRFVAVKQNVPIKNILAAQAPMQEAYRLMTGTPE